MHSQHQPFICIKILCFYWLHIFNHEHKKENANAFSLFVLSELLQCLFLLNLSFYRFFGHEP